MDEKFSNMAIMITNEQEKTLVRGNKPKKNFGPSVANRKEDLKFWLQEALKCWNKGR